MPTVTELGPIGMTRVLARSAPMTTIVTARSQPRAGVKAKLLGNRSVHHQDGRVATGGHQERFATVRAKL